MLCRLNQTDAHQTSQSVSTHQQRRPLITVDEVLQLGSEYQLILSANNPPLRCVKATYYRHRAFKELLRQ